MLDKTMDRFLAAALFLICGLAAMPLFGGEEPQTFSEPPTEWTFEAGEDGGYLKDAPGVYLDAAVIRVDRSSLGEALLVGGGVVAKEGGVFRLKLQYGSASGSEVGEFSPGYLVQNSAGNAGFFEVFRTPFEMRSSTLELAIAGEYRGETEEGTHYLTFGISGKGDAGLFHQQGLAMRKGTVAATLVNGDYLLLIGISDEAGPKLPSNRIEAWRERALAALAQAPVTSAMMDRDAEREGSPTNSVDGWRGVVLVDPGIELAQMAVALVDKELLEAARANLSGTPEQVHARLEAVKPWDNEHFDLPWNMRRQSHWPERKAAVVLSGAISHADALAQERADGFSDGPSVLSPIQAKEKFSSWTNSLLGQFDSLRTLALDPEPALLDAIVANEFASNDGALYKPHIAASLSENPGTSPKSIAAWAQLQELWLSRTPWLQRLRARGMGAMFGVALLPWLLALFAMTRKPKLKMEMVPGSFQVLVTGILMVLSVGKVSLAFVLVPVWYVAVPLWLVQHPRSMWQKLCAFLLLGSTMASAGGSFDLVPAVPLLSNFAASGQAFVFLWLGYLFAEAPERWSNKVWHLFLTGLLIVPLLALGGVADGLIMYALIGLYLFFLWESNNVRAKAASTKSGTKPKQRKRATS